MLLFGQTIKIYIKLDFVYFMYVNLGHLHKDCGVVSTDLCKLLHVTAFMWQKYKIIKHMLDEEPYYLHNSTFVLPQLFFKSIPGMPLKGQA